MALVTVLFQPKTWGYGPIAIEKNVSNYIASAIMVEGDNDAYNMVIHKAFEELKGTGWSLNDVIYDMYIPGVDLDGVMVSPAFGFPDFERGFMSVCQVHGVAYC